MKVGDIITLGNSNSEKNKYELVWIEAEDNPFNVKIFDCREFALNMISTTTNSEIASEFSKQRENDGKQYIGQFPANWAKCKVDFNYYTKRKQLADGIIFKAKEMEEKWDIYKYANFLFFVRSWTGNLVYVSNYIPTDLGFKVDLIVLDNSKVEVNDSFFEFKVVDFLIHSHVFGYNVPHPIPKSLANIPEEILEYSFSMFGSKGHFASYDFKISSN